MRAATPNSTNSYMRIADIITPQRIAVDAELGSKKAVLEKLSELLSSADPDLSSREVFSSLLARERLGTTGLGAGIAIPHGRVATENQSIGAFLRTGEPVNFDAVDSAPVDLFFALCVPEDANDTHLALLAELARRFSDDKYVARLRTSVGEDEVMAALLAEPGGG